MSRLGSELMQAECKNGAWKVNAHTLLILGVIEEDVWCVWLTNGHSLGLRYAFPRPPGVHLHAVHACGWHGLVKCLDAMSDAVCTQALLY